MSEAPATPPSARYRYFTVAPRTLDLPAEVLLSCVPTSARTGHTPKQSVTVTCSDIFRTNTPRVSSDRLREWLPDAIATDADLPDWLPLPVAKLALAYRPETRRELLQSAEQPKSEPGKGEPAPAAKSSESQPTPETPAPPALGPKSQSSWKRILKPVLGPSVEELQERHDRLRNPDRGEKIDPKPESKPAPGSPAPNVAPAQSEAAATPPVSQPPASPQKSEISPAKIALLQDLFHTDKELTLQDVADLANALPGLQGCILTVADDLRRSTDVPDGFDIREIRDRLLAVLESAPTESIRNGRPRTPALTLYFKDGPISILSHGSSSFLVVHQERSFLPGIRKILSTALETLEGTESAHS